MSASPTSIALDRIGHRYRSHGGLVLDSVSLSVGHSERLAIIGRSGCGKSTLLQIIAGLVHPSYGEVTIFQPQSATPTPRCTLMFQRPLLFPWLTVSENIALALRFSGRRSEIPVRVPYLLDLVGLDGQGNSRINEISGGQQQRVALARSLAVEPQILLLDEPFSALDVVTRSELRQQIRTILDYLKITFILVTHDVDDALDLAERVVVMTANPGRIVNDIRLPNSTSDADRKELRARLISALEPGAVSHTHDARVA
jgi:NitT/TauT family transport system ATP-binding protein